MKARDIDIQLSGFVGESRVNGPGRRVVVWVQGCTLGCPGCFNPTTHAPGGERLSTGALVDRILAARGPATDGVSFSGGEPFQQAIAVAAVAGALRGAWPEASLLAFSGYRLEELRSPGAPPGSADLLSALDLLVDGRYDARRPGRSPWRGSRNQRLWVLGRPVALEADPPAAELHIGVDGQILLSGLPDPRLRRAVVRLSGTPAAGPSRSPER